MQFSNKAYPFSGARTPFLAVQHIVWPALWYIDLPSTNVKSCRPQGLVLLLRAEWIQMNVHVQSNESVSCRAINSPQSYQSWASYKHVIHIFSLSIMSLVNQSCPGCVNHVFRQSIISSMSQSCLKFACKWCLYSANHFSNLLIMCSVCYSCF